MALGVVAAAAISAVVMVPLLAAAQQTGHSSSKSTLQERKVGKYGEVLTNSAGYSLYVLSTEQKGKLHCTSSSCLGMAAVAHWQERDDLGRSWGGGQGFPRRKEDPNGSHLQRVAGLHLRRRLGSGRV